MLAVMDEDMLTGRSWALMMSLCEYGNPWNKYTVAEVKKEYFWCEKPACEYIKHLNKKHEGGSGWSAHGVLSPPRPSVARLQTPAGRMRTLVVGLEHIGHWRLFDFYHPVWNSPHVGNRAGLLVRPI